MKRIAITCLVTGALVQMSSLGSVAHAAGPQPVPAASCNQGTAIGWQNVYDNVGIEYNVIPHWVDWDGDGESACYHLNPTYPPGAGSGLE